MAKVAKAVGVAVASQHNQALAKSVEQAMVAAIEKAQADGITDQEEIRRLMLEAKEAVLKG